MSSLTLLVFLLTITVVAVDDWWKKGGDHKDHDAIKESVGSGSSSSSSGSESDSEQINDDAWQFGDSNNIIGGGGGGGGGGGDHHEHKSNDGGAADADDRRHRHQHQQPPPSHCSGGNCVVNEPIHVATLSVESLTVGCQKVCGGNTATTMRSHHAESDTCVTTTLFNSCDRDSDCAQFRPSPASCHTSRCDMTTRQCSHTAMPGCCTSDDHCPERACHTAQCSCPDVGQAMLTKRSIDSGASHFGAQRFGEDLHFHHLATGDCRQQHCVYTRQEHCCVETFSNDPTNMFACNNMHGMCNMHESAFCDRGGVCQCVKEIEIQCTTDDDCNASTSMNNNSSSSTSSTSTTTTGGARKRTLRPRDADEFREHKGGNDNADDNKKERRESDSDSESRGSGSEEFDDEEFFDEEGDRRARIPRPFDRCARLKCSKSRICVPADGDWDGDGDGVPCREDCDDANGNVAHFIYCARAGTSHEPHKFNKDRDECIDCGAPVDKLCATECPTFVGGNITISNGNSTSSTTSTTSTDTTLTGSSSSSTTTTTTRATRRHTPAPTTPGARIRYFQVNESALCETPQSHGFDFWNRRFESRVELHVCFNCDCCANNSAGCDMPATCGIDHDNDRFPRCSSMRDACILQPAHHHNRRPNRGRFGGGVQRGGDNDGEQRFDFDDVERRFDDDGGRRDAERFDEQKEGGGDRRFAATAFRDRDSNGDTNTNGPDTNIGVSGTAVGPANADASCVAWAQDKGLASAASMVFITPEQAEKCEQCEERRFGEQEHNDKICYRDVDRDGFVQCPHDKNFRDCCRTILEYRHTDRDVEVEPTVRECCENPNHEHTGCRSAAAHPPIMTHQCRCEEPYIEGARIEGEHDEHDDRHHDHKHDEAAAGEHNANEERHFFERRNDNEQHRAGGENQHTGGDDRHVGAKNGERDEHKTHQSDDSSESNVDAHGDRDQHDEHRKVGGEVREGRGENHGDKDQPRRGDGDDGELRQGNFGFVQGPGLIIRGAGDEERRDDDARRVNPSHVDECPFDHRGYEFVTCYPDRDFDGTVDCREPIRICTRIREDKERACAEERSRGFPLFYVDLEASHGERKRGGEQGGNDEHHHSNHTHSFDHPMCDCDDRDCEKQSMVTCLPDHDHDGSPACRCQQRCGKCGDNEMAFDFAGPVRKRAIVETAALFNRIGKGEDFGEKIDFRSRQDSDDSQETKKQQQQHHENGDDWKFGDEKNKKQHDDHDGKQKKEGGGEQIGGDNDHRRPAHCPKPRKEAIEHQSCPAQQHNSYALIKAMVEAKNHKCDCCDTDPNAHHGSTFASVSPVSCRVDHISLLASHDYDCNGVNALAVACGGHVIHDEGKLLRKLNDTETFEVCNDTFLGSCEDGENKVKRNILWPSPSSSSSSVTTATTLTTPKPTGACTHMPGFVVDAIDAVEDAHTKHHNTHEESHSSSSSGSTSSGSSRSGESDESRKTRQSRESVQSHESVESRESRENSASDESRDSKQSESDESGRLFKRNDHDDSRYERSHHAVGDRFNPERSGQVFLHDAEFTPECHERRVKHLRVNDTTQLTDVMRIGECADFVTGCTSVKGKCYQDCDVCVLIGH